MVVNTSWGRFCERCEPNRNLLSQNIIRWVLFRLDCNRSERYIECSLFQRRILVSSTKWLPHLRDSQKVILTFWKLYSGISLYCGSCQIEPWANKESRIVLRLEMEIEYSLKKEQLFDIRDLKFYNLMLKQNFKTFGIHRNRKGCVLLCWGFVQ